MYCFDSKRQYLQYLENHSCKKIMLLSDTNVHTLYPRILDGLHKSVFSYILPAGEASKSFENAQAILAMLLQNGFTRGDVLVSFGGGMVGDIGGFCASLYMRGIEHVILPTTIISMADSAIGGKTAINFLDVKNSIGSFYEASRVFANVDFLNSLPQEEVQSGWGELLKIILLCGNTQNFDLQACVAQAVEYKQALVQQDPLDKGQRHLLNLGHSIGHVVELYYHLPHGIAVAVGLDYMAKVSDALQVSNGLQSKVRNLLAMCHLPNAENYPVNKKALQKLYADKKVQSTGQIKMVLLEDIGRASIHSLPVEEVIQLCLNNW